MKGNIEVEHALHQRLAAVMERLVDLPGPRLEHLTQVAAYSRFEDALLAAGLHACLGSDRTVVNRLLGVACEAAVEVFQQRRSTLVTLEHLPSEEEDVFIDDTAASSWTLIRGLYAGLASRHPCARQLAMFADDFEEPEGIIASDVLGRVAVAAALAVRGQDEVARGILEEASAEGDESDALWVHQARALLALLRGKADQWDAELNQVRYLWTNWYHAQSAQMNPEECLNLPVLGLVGLREWRLRA